MVIVVGNGLDDLSLDPEEAVYVSFLANTLRKGMNLSPPHKAMSK